MKKVAKIAPKEESPDVNSSPSLLEQLEMLAETAELERIVNSTAEKILSERIPSDIESAIR